MPNTKHLTTFLVLYIHFELAYIAYKEHLPNVYNLGVFNSHLLDSAVANPRQTFDGKSLYETLEEKAAILLYSLNMNHAFNDGNKRTSMLSTEIFLLLNGYRLNVHPVEYVEFARETADGKHSKEEVRQWIVGKIVKLDQADIEKWDAIAAQMNLPIG